PIVSLYSDKIDSHKLGAILGEFNIMCRVGYHCCHYYLLEKMKFPPLLRISLGLHNTPEQIDFLVEKLKSVVSSF
ncbi:MAG: aminotransferase class V-fold PLP-dependent enzyme, partial [Dolichospermum sp.]